jgi:hypothetical protein
VDRGSQSAPTCEIFWTFKGGFGGGRGLLVRHGCVSLGRRILNLLLASWAGESARCSLSVTRSDTSRQTLFFRLDLLSRSVACFQPSFSFMCAKLRPLSRFTSVQGGLQFASRAPRRWRQTPPHPLSHLAYNFLLILWRMRQIAHTLL